MADSNSADEKSGYDAPDIADAQPDDGVTADGGADKDVAANESSQESQPSEPDAVADEVARLRDQYIRLQADFDNYRKRVLRDEAARARRANERMVTELLPALDHFEMGLQAARVAGVPDAVYDGLALVLSQMMDVLKKEGVAPVETDGVKFDPQCHECVVHQPSPDHPENTIITETRRGWWMGEYLLRPAQVVVSSGLPCVDDNFGNAADEPSDADIG